MKKRIFASLVVFILVTLMVAPTALAATQESYGNSTIYVHDNGDLLSSSEETGLINHFGPMFEDKSYNVLFLTTNNADGKSTMAWSDDYMDDLFPSYEHNIAFVIDMDNREIYINTMGNAILCLTDSMIEKALDKGYNYVADEEYYDCLVAMGDYCASRLTDNPGNGAYDEDGDGYADDSTREAIVDGAINGLLPGGIVTGILCFVLVTSHNKANKVQSASTYMGKDQYEVKDKNEVFVRSYERVHRDYYKPKSSSSGGSRGGGSSHRSSSGRSHGGGGRKF